MVKRSVLLQIFKELREVKAGLSDIEKTLTAFNTNNVSLETNELLQLPDHLRKTYLVAVRCRKGATAFAVSIKTGRGRAVESGYLNQLVRMGWLRKIRNGRVAIFYPTLGVNKK